MEHASEHHHVHGGPKLYGAILAALLVLTVITVAVSYVPTNSQFVNILIAMAIATVKATLVGMFFMHLRWDKPVNAVIFVSGVFFLGILLTYTLLDSFSRPDLYPTQTTDRTGMAPPSAEAVTGAEGDAPAGTPENPPPAGDAAPQQ